MAYTDIDKPSNYFETKLYTGNGGTQSITGLDFEPDWVWCKVRSSDNHAIFDSVRGGQKQLRSNTADGELTRSNAISSFNSDGFTMGGQPEMNTNGQTYVAWNWIESATSGFDIVAYTGNATNRTISHSCGSAPRMIITKSRAGNNWFVYHESMGNTDMIKVNQTNAKETKAAIWNNTSPTSSVFTVGTDNDANEDGVNFIAYCFAEKQGYSKFGNYTGNGSANGPFCYTGFKPSFILGKRTDSAGGWWIIDNKRPGFNLTNEYLLANDVQAEASDGSFASDFLSNGWKARADNGNFNADGGTYIYMAFAENPFTTSTGIPATAR